MLIMVVALDGGVGTVRALSIPGLPVAVWKPGTAACGSCPMSGVLVGWVGGRPD